MVASAAMQSKAMTRVSGFDFRSDPGSFRDKNFLAPGHEVSSYLVLNVIRIHNGKLWQRKSTIHNFVERCATLS